MFKYHVSLGHVGAAPPRDPLLKWGLFPHFSKTARKLPLEQGGSNRIQRMLERGSAGAELQMSVC